MANRIALLREAARSALQLRRSLSIPREHAVNVFDVVSSIGIEVQFMDLPSLEGMFYRGPDPKIILPALKHRPRGRVSYSCAHELGHFQLGHGTRVDEYVVAMDQPKPKPDEEITADTFAATLLMPRPAVLERFACRGWSPESASPMQVFRLSGELDVGYTTLIKHLRYGLEIVNNAWVKERERVTPKTLRETITHRTDCRRVVVVDRHWPQIPVDIEVGDYVAIPKTANPKLFGLLEEDKLNGEWHLVRAQRSGQTRLGIDGVMRAVRIARSGYCGLLQYRYFEDFEVV